MGMKARLPGALCAMLVASLALGSSSAPLAQDGPSDPEAMRRMMEERNRLPDTPGALAEVQRYAEAVGATRLDITGYRAAVELSDGELLVERNGISRVRTREVARMFEGLIDSIEEINVASSEEFTSGGWEDRKVTITVYP